MKKLNTKMLKRILAKATIIATSCIFLMAGSLMMLISWVSDRTENPLYTLGGLGMIAALLGALIMSRVMEETV